MERSLRRDETYFFDCPGCGKKTHAAFDFKLAAAGGVYGMKANCPYCNHEIYVTALDAQLGKETPLIKKAAWGWEPDEDYLETLLTPEEQEMYDKVPTFDERKLGKPGMTW